MHTVPSMIKLATGCIMNSYVHVTTITKTLSHVYYFFHLVHPSIVEHPVKLQSIYPGKMVNLSCKAEGFSTLSYSWFMVDSDSDFGVEIRNTTNPTYTISNPIFDQNNTGYYCVATNNEGIAVSNTSTLIGNNISTQLISCIYFPSNVTVWYYSYNAICD